MFHLSAYTAAALTSAVDTDIPAIQDNLLVVQNNHILPQKPMQIWGAYAISALLLRAQVSTPKTRMVNKLYIRPIDFGAALPSANPNMANWTSSPYAVNQFEEIQVLATSSTGTSERFFAMIWLMDTFEPIPIGDVYTMRWTSTVTDVIYTWTAVGTPTFEQTPPLGIYTVIDSEWYATSAIAHRLTFDNQFLRPGNFGFANNHSRYPYIWKYGKLGVWGRFTNTNLPRVELLSGVADSSHEGYMHVIKT